MPNQSVTADLNFLTQFSEKFLDNLLKALYDAGAFPTAFKGNFPTEQPGYNIEITGRYDILLLKPDLFLDTSISGGIGLKASANGMLELRFEILPGNSPTGQYVIPVNVECSMSLIGKIQLAHIDSLIYIQLSFSDLTDLELKIASFNLPESYRELVRQIVKRILLVAFRNKVVNIPLSPSTEGEVVGGWAVVNPQLRIIDGPTPPDFDTINLGFNTFPNAGLGRIEKVRDWVNERHNDFGVAIDQRLILQSLQRFWLRDQIPKRFDNNGKPNPAGKIIFRDFAFDLLDNTITLSVQLQTTVANIPIGTWIHARAALSVVDSEIHVGIIDVDFEIPVIIDIVGFLLLNIVWVIVQDILRNILGSLIQDTINTNLDAFVASSKIKLGFEGKIAGTDLKVKALVTNVTATADDLYSSGNVLITKSI